MKNPQSYVYSCECHQYTGSKLRNVTCDFCGESVILRFPSSLLDKMEISNSMYEVCLKVWKETGRKQILGFANKYKESALAAFHILNKTASNEKTKRKAWCERC